MNIFFIDRSPYEATIQQVDKHVVKMPLETAQILSTVHRTLDGTEYIDNSSGRKIKRWSLDIFAFDNTLYKATHVNHPCTKWASYSLATYDWTFRHFVYLLEEYNARYGKVHACNALVPLLKTPPRALINTEWIDPPKAMPMEFQTDSDPVICYRKYYRYGKANLHVWKTRSPPEWMTDDSI